MRVLFLQQQPCVRALKYAVALRGALPGIALGFAYQGKTLNEWYGSGDEVFERWWNLGENPVQALEAAVDEFRPDLIHSHNLPDSLTAMALELFTERVPVVHDVHDLQSLRRTPYEHGFPEPREPLALERLAIEQCSALVTVSDELLDEIRARYRPTAPMLAFPNYALGRDLPPVLPPAERRNGHRPRLVYQGTLSTNGGHYDLRAIFRSIVSEGLSLDVYPSRPAPEYAELGLRLHETLPPRRLLSALPEYDFGWAGFNSTLNGAHLDTCLPNKAYEYIGCGLPVLTLRHRALTRLVGDGSLGVSLATLDDLGGQLAAVDVVEVRRRIASARFELTVEANIHRLIELYEAVSPARRRAGVARAKELECDRLSVSERFLDRRLTFDSQKRTMMGRERNAVVENQTQHLRVLIANERLDRLKLLAKVVAGLGHEVIASEVDVTEVGAVTAREHPDVALVGLGLSSEHALTLIAEIVHEASCPVIALLSTRDPAYVREAAKAGIFAYIVDTTPEELQSAIDITLQRFTEYHSLQGAFGRRAMIEQAKGILMARHAITADDAFERLRDHSQHNGHKLSEVAVAVVDSHLLLPAPMPESQAAELEA